MAAADTTQTLGILAFILATVMLIAVLLISNGVIVAGTWGTEPFEGEQAAAVQRYVVAFIYMKGCGACTAFSPVFGSVTETANRFYQEKPSCPRIVRFKEVNVYSEEAKALFSAGLPKPNGVPHVALFSEQGKQLRWVGSLGDGSYSFTGLMEWINQLTQVDKCSGWLSLARGQH